MYMCIMIYMQMHAHILYIIHVRVKNVPVSTLFFVCSLQQQLNGQKKWLDRSLTTGCADVHVHVHVSI